MSLTIRMPGPVAGRFFADWDNGIQCIMGPVGSGKTTTALAKAIWACYRQPPSPVDGVRRYRVTVVRRTYRDLWESTIKSLFEFAPRTEANFTGSPGNPASYYVRSKMVDGSIVDGELQFRALGEDPIGSLRGYQTSVFLVEEADLVPWEWIQIAQERRGRYPRRDPHGEAWYAGVWLTSNAFDVDSEIYDAFLVSRRPGHALYRQPGAREPGAENVENLRRGYYDDLIATSSPDRIRRMVDNIPGYSREGKPVFLDEWQDPLHVAETPPAPMPGVPIRWGADAGLTPAAVAAQRLPSGQWVVLHEIAETGGVERIAEAIRRILAGEAYAWLRNAEPGDEIVSGYGDPAAMSRSPTDERVWLAELERLSGFRWRPAPSNNITPRLSAIRRPLTRLVGGAPGLVISPACGRLRRAFASGYRFRRLAQAGGGTRYDDIPEKNHPDSDLVDALGYLLLGSGEFEGIGRPGAAARPRQTRAAGPSSPPAYAGPPRHQRFATGPR